jgi:hypothetical protein
MSSQAPTGELMARFGVSPARRRKDRIARGDDPRRDHPRADPARADRLLPAQQGPRRVELDFFTTDPTGNTFFKNSRHRRHQERDPRHDRDGRAGLRDRRCRSGVGVALWLVEYGKSSWFAQVVRFFVDVLTGVPSIVFGLFIYIVLIVGTGSSFAGYKGSLALSLLMLPVVIRSAEVILLLVPAGLRESALALGAPRWKVIFSIVLPTALPGMVTGVLLAVARAAGETAPLLFTAGSHEGHELQPERVHELAACANLQRRHLADHRRREPGLGRRAHARRHDPAAQPHRPPHLAKESPCMSPPDRPQRWLTWTPTAHPGSSAASRSSMAQSEPDGPRRSRRMTAERPPRRRGRTSKPGLSVRLEQLRAFYGDAEQVKGIDLEFRANEVTAIIGPSGCGKSTMIRCINRMHEEIPGARAEGKRAARRHRRLRPRCRRRGGPPRDRHGLPETEPLSHDVDLRQRRRGPAPERPARRGHATPRSRRRCAARACGARSPTASTSRERASRAASSSGCASRARWRSDPR